MDLIISRIAVTSRIQSIADIIFMHALDQLVLRSDPHRSEGTAAGDREILADVYVRYREISAERYLPDNAVKRRMEVIHQSLVNEILAVLGHCHLEVGTHYVIVCGEESQGKEYQKEGRG